MKFYRRQFLVGLSVVALAACHGGSRPPTGQVVARVGGQEVTVRELNAQMGSPPASDPAARKAQMQSALAYIVARKALAQMAHKQGLDKSPDFALQRDAGVETLLASAAQARLIATVPQPTDDEIQQFIAENPTLFAQREVLTVDAIEPKAALSEAQLEKFTPLKTLDQVAGQLNQMGGGFNRHPIELDTANLNPKLVEAIKKLPSGEVFITRNSDAVIFAVLRDARAEPLSGAAATAAAQRYAHDRDIKEAEARQMAQALQSAKVVYNPSYRSAAGDSAKAGR